jgi:methionyl-tRNA synthetase
MAKYIVTATPPTTNGDLHVGHLSGPYLAADIFCRGAKARGHTATYVSFGDDNQSYILTTAENRGRDPVELLREGNAEIVKTLVAAGIVMDRFTPVSDGHKAFVSTAFCRLHALGKLEERVVDLPYDANADRFLFESYLSGSCPVCLVTTKAGVCEDCGHPNDVADLIAPRLSTGGPILERRPVKRLYLPVQRYRHVIERYYAEHGGAMRPRLRTLTQGLLSRPLPDFPMTHPTTWGVPVELDGWNGHAWNAMAEMGIGLLHTYLTEVGQATIEDGTQLINFLGFDNSYFFLVVQLAIASALADQKDLPTKVPDFILTNEFFNLENAKFSTSKGHAIWGRELLKDYGVDEARFYIAMNAPETMESNFDGQHMQSLVSSRLRPAIAALSRDMDAYASGSGTEDGSAVLASVAAAVSRLQHCYEPDCFSVREASQQALRILEYLADNRKLAKIARSGKCDEALRTLCSYVGPIIPGAADQCALRIAQGA